MLNVDAVTVKRGKTFALQDVSLTLAPGQTLSIVGESGAGKSTLIATILGLLSPSRGTITWSDAPVRQCRPALVMQEPRAAFNPALTLRQSVMEPLLASKQQVSDDRLEQLCRGLELDPQLLTRRSTEVSVGQAQRVGILRALISAPPLVLFDEPLSALDAVTQKHTAKLIAELQSEEGFSALIVTHDLELASKADRCLKMKEGKIQQ